MSVDNPNDTTLSDFTDPRPNWEPNPAPNQPATGASVKCRTCENTVSQRYAKVFGDNDDQIDYCPECSTYREMKDGAFDRGEVG